MEMERLSYSNLTGLLFKVIRTKPGMYLGRNHISRLSVFILGYEFRDLLENEIPDFYFGDTGFCIGMHIEINTDQ